MGQTHSTLSTHQPSSTRGNSAAAPAGSETSFDFKDPVLVSLPSKEIKLRDGNVTGAVPSPGDEATYNLLIQREQFKKNLLQNLDHDYLLKSIMNEGAVDDDVLVQGIRSITKLDQEQKSQIANEVKDFEECLGAGVNVDLSETLTICEKELQVLGEINASPFLLSFQRRLALLMNIRGFLVNDKNRAHQQYMPRVYSNGSNHLSVEKFPELEVLESLTKSGISILDIFNTCYPVLIQHGGENAINTIIDPVRQMCSDISKLTDLQLYSCWAPAPEPIKVAIALNNSSVACSNGVGNLAVDGKNSTAWSTNKTRASWSVEYKSPVHLSAIRIAWVPDNGVAGELGAPRRMIVSVIYESDDTNKGKGKGKGIDENEKMGDNKYEVVSTFMPDFEYLKQGTWKQTYKLFMEKDENARKVIGVRLSISRKATSNLTTSVKMYSFEAFAYDEEVTRFKALDVMALLSTSLFPVVKYEQIQDIALCAVVSLMRASGSLKILLIFVKHILEMLENADSSVRNFLQRPLPLDTLFTAINNEDDIIKNRLNASKLTIQNEVFFSSTLKSSEHIDVVEDGLCATSTSGASNSTKVYNILTNVMSTGVWVWELTILFDVSENNLSGIGVAMPTVTNGDYESSPDMYIIQCATGKIFLGGAMDGMPPINIPNLKKNDICQFYYDVDISSLSLKVNGKDYGVIIQGIPKGFSPIVILAGPRKSIRLGKVYHKVPMTVEDKKDSCNPSKAKDIGTENVHADVGMNASQSTSKLLSILAKLSKSRANELNQDEPSTEKEFLTEKNQSNLLEYPFCVAVSFETIMALIDLLKEKCTEGLQENNDNILSILQIVDTQFLCLTKSQVDPADLGFLLSNREDKALSKSILEASETLLSYLQNDNVDIQVAAARVYARGSSIFLPSVWDKIELVLRLVDDSVTGYSSNGDNRGKDKTMVIILEIIINRLSSLNNVLEIIEMVKTSDESIREKVEAFLTFLLEFSSKQFNNTVLSSIGNETSVSDFYISTVLLLSRFQENLILDVANFSNQSTTSSSSRSKVLCASTVKVLFSYYDALSSSCIKTMRSAMQLYKSNMDHVIIRSELDAKIRESIVASLLLPLVHSLAFCTSNLQVCEGLLPTSLSLLQDLSSVCRESTHCVQAQNLLSSMIRRKNPIQQLQGDGHGSGRSGWQTIDASFQDYNSYVTKDDRKIYASTTSGNTCGMLDCCFGPNDRAAWEWKLLHDTRDDECSIFGIARKPLSSRCYSSSTDLWMRRGEYRSIGV